MKARTQPDGTLVIDHDRVRWARVFLGVAAPCALYLLQAASAGTLRTERAAGVALGFATCLVTAAVLWERARFTVDPRRRVILWRRRWGWSYREGTIPFDAVREVLVQASPADDGSSSRRVVLRLEDGSDLPLTAGFLHDSHNAVVDLAGTLRAAVGRPSAPDGLDLVRALLRDGRRIDAIKLLRETQGLSLEEASKRVRQLKD